MIKPNDLKDEEIWSMLRAAHEGDLHRIKELLSRRPALVSCEYNYTPPIHFAVREGHTDVVGYLLEKGVDPTRYRSYPFQDSLLTVAQDREHHEIAQMLLEIASRRFPVTAGLEGFLKMARDGNLAQVQAELGRNPALARASNDTGDTALHQAAAGAHISVMTALLDSGANVDAIRADGVRPIHCALKAGIAASVLLDRGAEYNIYIAAMLGDIAYAREALSRDPALANFEETSHFRPISAAARRNDLE